MIIKKFNILFLQVLFAGLLANVSTIQAIVYGKSFFVLPAFFRPASPEQIAALRYQLQVGEASKGCHQQFTVTPFGGGSVNSSKHLAEYFLPYHAGNAKTLIAGELGSQAVNNNSVNLIAKYFGVLTAPLPADGDPYVTSDYTFQSTLTFEPQQTFAGVNFNYRFHLSRYLDKGFWIELGLPLTHITNNLNMTEVIETAGGPTGNNPVVPAGYFGNMTDALKQNAYSYGKIDGPVTKLGLGDLQFRVGYVYADESHYYLNTYLGILVPVASKPTNEFLFEPTIGSNGHFGGFSGASVGVRIWSRCERSIYWILDTAGTLLFATHQLRSIDLQGRPWSRYLPVFLSDAATQMNPGINSLTLPVEIVPDTVRDLNIAFVYKHEGLHAEFGYHFYGRSTEKIKTLHSINGTLAVASDLNTEFSYSPDTVSYIYQDPADNQNTHNTKSYASINRYLQINNDQSSPSGEFNLEYQPLTDADLDLTSAAHPPVISNVFYVAVGMHLSNTTTPFFIGLGASYELPDDNAGINKMMAWLRMDLSF